MLCGSRVPGFEPSKSRKHEAAAVAEMRKRETVSSSQHEHEPPKPSVNVPGVPDATIAVDEACLDRVCLGSSPDCRPADAHLHSGGSLPNGDGQLPGDRSHER